MHVGVDCTFSASGIVQVKRIQLDGVWQVVEQGRQWLDGDGHHVLIMFTSGRVRELVFNTGSFIWELRPDQPTRIVV